MDEQRRGGKRERYRVYLSLGPAWGDRVEQTNGKWSANVIEVGECGR